MPGQGHGVFVGQARVLGTATDGRPRVLVFDRRATVAVADWALPFRYEPTAGDLLLVMGQHDRFWVTGVTHGHGRSQLAFLGDAALHARGVLRLASDAGVRLRGPEVEMRSHELESSATSVVQKLGGMQSTTQGTLDERAGQCSRMIDGEDRQVAGRHATVALHKVKIDGDLLVLS
ncbi:MAG TPA: hypothetical protein VFZ65_10945 [Planctomycetota bacterium]|nr:hypothetical protein [Planctomycetota bacterium]